MVAVRDGHPARWMVWDGTPIEDNVKRLDELGLQSTVYNPCDNMPENGDFLTVMRQNVENLTKALEK